MSLKNHLLRFLQPKVKAVQMPLLEAINHFRINSIDKLDQSLDHDALQVELLKNLTVSILGSRWLHTPDALAARNEFGHWLNWNGLVGQGVEVGVLRGGFSKQLLDTWQGKVLFSIDPWMEFSAEEYVDVANQPQDKQNENFRITQTLLGGYGGRSNIIRQTSADAARLFDDGSLDFVYLDAQHHYEAVRDDIAIWYPKIKSGGIIGGHDYLNGIIADSIFGVKQAVDEFSAAIGTDVIVTREPEFKSWFIRKP